MLKKVYLPGRNFASKDHLFPIIWCAWKKITFHLVKILNEFISDFTDENEDEQKIDALKKPKNINYFDFNSEKEKTKKIYIDRVNCYIKNLIHNYIVKSSIELPEYYNSEIKTIKDFIIEAIECTKLGSA